MLAFAGDVAPVQRAGNYSPTRYSCEKDVSNLLLSCFCIGNLEAVVTDSIDFDRQKEIVYKVAKNARSLLSQFDYLNVANNHSLDYKKQGLRDTLRFLDNNHILHTGSDARFVVLFVGGVKIGLFSATDHPLQWRNDLCYLPLYEPSTLSHIHKVVRAMKAQQVELVIFSYHYGPNYKPSIEKYKRFFVEILRRGVDVVHGHSAHHIAKISRFVVKNKSKYIIYCNGEFINDYGWDSRERSLYHMDLSMLVLLDVHTRRLRVVPLEIQYERVGNSQFYADIACATVRKAHGSKAETVHNIVRGKQNVGS